MNLTTLREYYEGIGIDIDTVLELNHELTVSDLTLQELIQKSTEIKREMMEEAEKSTIKHNLTQNFIEKESRFANPFDITKWPGVFINYYSDSDLIIGAQKPGKEAGADYRLSHYKKCKCSECKSNGRKPVRGGNSPNVHDMLPVIISDKRNLAVKITYTSDGRKLKRYTPWTLDQICNPLEDLLVQKYGIFGLEIFGTILFRAALNMDHHLQDGKWRMQIPNFSLESIEKCLPHGKMRFLLGHLPSEFSVASMLYFFDVLGVNEDIKVHGKGRVSNFMEPITWRQYDAGKVPSKLAFNGRTNTLLTYCEMIAIMLNRSSVGNALIGYQRGGGIYPFRVEEKGIDYAFMAFPLLSPQLPKLLDLDITEHLGWLHSAQN